MSNMSNNSINLVDFNYFNKFLQISIFLTDSDVFIKYTAAPLRKSFAAENYGMLSEKLASTKDLFNTRSNNIKKTGKLKKVYAGNARLINKFATHGKKSRSLKYFAKALNYLLIHFKNYNISAISLLLNNNFNIFYLSELSLINKRALPNLIENDYSCFNYTDDNGFYTYNDLFSQKSLADVEFIYENMRDVAPVYSFILKRVDKMRYKHSRGKAGRYEMHLKYIPRRAGTIYMLNYLKHTWNFSRESTYLRRYVATISKAAIIPNQSLGFILGNRAFKKIIEK